MTVYALTGNDTLILNDKIMDGFADGTTIELSFPNDKIGKSTGKNGNTVISSNKQGDNATLTLRFVKTCDSDIYLNGLSILQDNDLPSFSLINGTFAKRIGGGQGKANFDNYVLLGGAFQKNPDVQENLNGETEQGVTVYTIFFSSAKRGIA